MTPQQLYVLSASLCALAAACDAGPSVQPAAAVAEVGATASVVKAAAPSEMLAAAPSEMLAASSAPVAAPSVPPVDSAPSLSLPLFDLAGKPLPQTDQRPAATSDRFVARMQRVVDALRTGDLEVARAAFFPLVAYEQVKAIANPKLDYEQRLLSAYFRDLSALRAKLGKAADSLRFVGVDVPDAHVQWMAKGKEGNRIGYYRVKRTRLRVAAGRELEPIPIVSMISWRGEWYVVHLSGFK